MSRNGSGTYSLVAGNPVVTGTVISSTTMNNTLSDIATALTGSVAADGQTPITGALVSSSMASFTTLTATIKIVFGVGAVGTPSLYMTGYATTGWYNIGANNWGFAVSGAKVLDIASTGLSVTGTLSSTGDYKIAGTGIYNATATNTSLGLFADTNAYAGIKVYGSSHATKANVTELLAGTGVVVGSVSSTGLAVTGTLSATGNISATAGDVLIRGATGGQITQNTVAGGLYFANTGTSTNMRFYTTDGAGASVLALTLNNTTGLGTFANGLAVTGDISVSTKTPASAGAAGVAGTITWDASFLYVCTATDTWKRVAIATW